MKSNHEIMANLGYR